MRSNKTQSVTAQRMLHDFSQKVLGKVFQKKRNRERFIEQAHSWMKNDCARRIADKLMNMDAYNQEDLP